MWYLLIKLTFISLCFVTNARIVRIYTGFTVATSMLEPFGQVIGQSLIIPFLADVCMEESTCHKFVIDLLKRFSCMKHFSLIFNVICTLKQFVGCFNMILVLLCIILCRF